MFQCSARYFRSENWEMKTFSTISGCWSESTEHVSEKLVKAWHSLVPLGPQSLKNIIWRVITDKAFVSKLSSILGVLVFDVISFLRCFRASCIISSEITLARRQHYETSLRCRSWLIEEVQTQGQAAPHRLPNLWNRTREHASNWLCRQLGFSQRK